MNKKRAYLRIRALLKKSKNVFIMGHNDLDLDAIGSALGIYDFVRQMKKNAFIIMNDKKHEAGVRKILEMVDDDIFVKSSEIGDDDLKDSLLIIVDTNKKSLFQDSLIASKVSHVVIIDHHDVGEDTLTSADVSLIDKDASSASELVVEFMYYFSYSIRNMYSSFLLSGITLDTNNFTAKTGSKTHQVAYHLIESGADVKFVNTLLKQDLEDYILRQKVITDVEIIHRTIAFAKGSNRVIYKREELAKIADTLLEFNHIETSYVIGKLEDNVVGISARSSGSIHVGKVLSLLGGGGDATDAACRIENQTLKEVESSLKKVLGEYK